MPVEKLSRKRTQFCSRGAEVPPDVMRAMGVWWAVCRVVKLVSFDVMLMLSSLVTDVAVMVKNR